MTTLVLGALEGEVSAHRDRLSGRNDDRWRDLRISSGMIGTNAVVVANTGVGKTMSALVTQHLIDVAAAERVLYVGMGGALNPKLEIGDVVVATESLQYDLEARGAGFEPGQVPYTPYRTVPSDPALVSMTLGLQVEGFRLVRGRVLTGDRFLYRSENEGFQYPVQEMGGDAVDMEGASAGLVALVNGLPYLLLRVISDQIGEQVKVDFKKALQVTSERTAVIVERLLVSLGG